MYVLFFFFKQKTAYEMRISDWSSDVCSSDLKCAEQRTVIATLSAPVISARTTTNGEVLAAAASNGAVTLWQLTVDDVVCLAQSAVHSTCKIGRASCRERGCQ